MKQKEISIAINCYIIAFAFVLLAVLTFVVLYMPNIREFDQQILHAVQGVLIQFPISVAEFVSRFGAGDFWLWPRITAVAVMISHKYYMKAFLFVIFTQLTYHVNDDWLKPLICRERPCDSLAAGFSFPSGHVAFQVCMCGILIYLVHKYVNTDWWRTILITIFSIWIVAVCVSRMWLNAHFLTDVTAGFCVGIIMVNLYIILDKFFSK